MSEENGNSEKPENITKRNIVIFTTILLGLIAVATAWSGYQASNWSSQNSSNTALANANRSNSVKASLTANQLTMLDIQIFIEWLNATAQDNTGLATFYRERMRDEARLAFDAWLAQDPLNNLDAPSSPFIMEEYIVQKRVEAVQLENSAVEFSDTAAEASSVSGEYVLSAVILASALFFAGLSTRLRSTKIEITFASISLLLFAYGIYRLVTLWINHGE